MAQADLSLSTWQQAYLRFESPEAERAKFASRLRRLGVTSWNRRLRILEICCGRGSALAAWHDLGFENVEGLDLSLNLASEYRRPSKLIVGDVRAMPLTTASYDVVAVQGGLHHLNLPHDLARSVEEIHRVLKPGGRLLMVEPWLTPFLQIVHAACRSEICRRTWRKLDDLATMIEHEQATYNAWLSQPQAILHTLHERFQPERQSTRLGKLMMVARKSAA